MNKNNKFKPDQNKMNTKQMHQINNIIKKEIKMDDILKKHQIIKKISDVWITHYIIAKESDPRYKNNESVNAIGLDKAYKKNFYLVELVYLCREPV